MKRPWWTAAVVVLVSGALALAVTWIATGGLTDAAAPFMAQSTPPLAASLLQQQVTERIAVRKRSLAALRKFYAATKQRALPKSVQWEPFRPIVECPTEQRLGSDGDGGKWVCITPKLARREPCVVYSMGSAGRTDFEHAIFTNVGCEIHVFDPTLDAEDEQKMKPLIDNGTLTYHRWGVSFRDETRQLVRKGVTYNATLLTIDSMMAKLGHTAVDILKVDVEGIEWAVLPAFLRPGMPPIGQLQLELHDYATKFMGRVPPPRGRNYDKMDYLFDDLETHGLYAFHSEVNAAYDKCSEFAFIHHSLLPVQELYPARPQIASTIASRRLERRSRR